MNHRHLSCDRQLTVSNDLGGEIEFSLRLVPQLGELESLWRSLETPAETSFFVSWIWIGTWLQCLPDRIHPFLLTGSRKGQPIGAAILVPYTQRRHIFVHARQLHFNSTGEAEFDCITIEHNGFVGSREANGVLWPAFLDWFSHQKNFDELMVPGTCDGAIPISLSTLLYTTTRRPAYLYAISERHHGSIVSVLSRNARQQLHRNLRAAEGLGGLRLEPAATVDTALSWFKSLKEFHVRTWQRRGRPHAFRYSFFEQFHYALIKSGLPQQAVEILRASVGNSPIGYLYNFRRGESIYAYQSGFDDLAHLIRPGYISHLAAIEQSAASGMRCYDFLAGDNQLKRTFCTTSYTMCWSRFARMTPILELEATAKCGLVATCRLLTSLLKAIWHRAC